jgi:putative protein-disulfide isomerase
MTELPVLEYGFDPLCGWCYAFGPSIDAMRAAFPGAFQLRLLQGGLVVGERVQPMRLARDYLLRAMPEAERRSGVKFGAAFKEGLLREDDYAMGSEPACRAVVVACELAAQTANADAGVDFGLSLTRAIYRDGRKPDDPATLATLAEQVGLSPDSLVTAWASDGARARTQRAFAEARQAGISMYPTLRWREGDRRTELLRGYLGPDESVALVADRLRGTSPPR